MYAYGYIHVAYMLEIGMLLDMKAYVYVRTCTYVQVYPSARTHAYVHVSLKRSDLALVGAEKFSKIYRPTFTLGLRVYSNFFKRNMVTYREVTRKMFGRRLDFGRGFVLLIKISSIINDNIKLRN